MFFQMSLAEFRRKEAEWKAREQELMETNDMLQRQLFEARSNGGTSMFRHGKGPEENGRKGAELGILGSSASESM